MQSLPGMSRSVGEVRGGGRTARGLCRQSSRARGVFPPTRTRRVSDGPRMEGLVIGPADSRGRVHARGRSPMAPERGNSAGIEPADGKLAVMIAGMGAVATTFVAGVEAGCD